MSKYTDEQRKKEAEEAGRRRAQRVLRELITLAELRGAGKTQQEAAKVLNLSARSVRYREDTMKQLLSRKGLRRTTDE